MAEGSAARKRAERRAPRRPAASPPRGRGDGAARARPAHPPPDAPRHRQRAGRRRQPHLQRAQGALNTTDGNLSVHARKLEDAQYVDVLEELRGAAAADGVPAHRARPARARALPRPHGGAHPRHPGQHRPLTPPSLFFWEVYFVIQTYFSVSTVTRTQAPAASTSRSSWTATGGGPRRAACRGRTATAAAPRRCARWSRRPRRSASARSRSSRSPPTTGSGRRAEVRALMALLRRLPPLRGPRARARGDPALGPRPPRPAPRAAPPRDPAGRGAHRGAAARSTSAWPSTTPRATRSPRPRAVPRPAGASARGAFAGAARLRSPAGPARPTSTC